MKKTLFAMMAVALCGTAFAGDKYMSDQVAGGSLDISNDGFTVHVNAPVTLSSFMVGTEGAATFKFYGENIISSTNFNLYSDGMGFDITGDEAAINHWVSALSSPTGELKSVTLVSFTFSDVFTDTDDEFLFNGHFSGETVTLGNVSVEFMGSGYVETSDFYETMNEVLSENQIALIRQENGVIIAGKITGSPATPEPATATLSLLALAGLASRRRRH